MKISKLIKKLEKILKEYGDLDCGYEDNCQLHSAIINTVNYNKIYGEVVLS